MKADWDKESGGWQVFDDGKDQRRALVKEVHFMVPAVLVTTDGGRHGYAVADGELTIKDDIATIRRKRDG